MYQFQFHHLCIQTDCYEQSLAFYQDILGATLLQETPNFHTRDFNTWLQLGDFAIELQTAKAGQPLIQMNKHMNGLAHFCLLTADVTAAVQMIQARGYKKFQTKNQAIIYQVEGSHLAKVIAPEGTIIEIRDNPLF